MRFVNVSGIFAAGLIAAGIALSQQAPPTENKGVAVKPVGAMNLGSEIDGMSGRQLRMRFITMEPEGHFAVPNHKEPVWGNRISSRTANPRIQVRVLVRAQAGA